MKEQWKRLRRCLTIPSIKKTSSFWCLELWLVSFWRYWGTTCVTRQIRTRLKLRVVKMVKTKTSGRTKMKSQMMKERPTLTRSKVQPRTKHYLTSTRSTTWRWCLQSGLTLEWPKVRLEPSVVMRLLGLITQLRNGHRKALIGAKLYKLGRLSAKRKSVSKHNQKRNCK